LQAFPPAPASIASVSTVLFNFFLACSKAISSHLQKVFAGTLNLSKAILKANLLSLQTLLIHAKLMDLQSKIKFQGLIWATHWLCSEAMPLIPSGVGGAARSGS